MLLTTLGKKIDRLIPVLQTCPSIHLLAENEATLDDKQKMMLLRNSIWLLSDYLTTSTLEVLCKSYDINTESLKSKKPEKKSAFAQDVVDADMPLPPPKPPSVPAASSKKKATTQKKIDTTGMKGLMNYFSKS